MYIMYDTSPFLNLRELKQHQIDSYLPNRLSTYAFHDFNFEIPSGAYRKIIP